MTTPNMQLSLPIPSVTLGPVWAEELNIALELIDLHDHTSNKGVKVPTAGLNINADLSFAGNAALSLKHVGISSDSIDPVIPGAIYVKNGDLYFTSSTVTAVQLTDGTSIKGVTGNISGLGDGGSSAAFNDFTEDFTFKFNSGDKFAAMNIGEVRMYPFDGVNAYSNPITLKAPLSLASAYQITLPESLPLADNVMSITSAGVIQQGIGNGTAAAPSIAFASDSDTGIYRPSSNVLGLTTGGAVRAEVSDTAFTIYSSKLFTTGTGSATVPSVVPGSGSTTGFSGISGTLHMVNSGVNTMTLTSTSVKSEVSLVAAVGLTVQAGGINVTGGGVISGGLNLNTSALTNVTNISSTGTLTCGSIETGGGGSLKFKLYSGNISGVSTVLITAPSTIAAIYGVVEVGGSAIVISPSAGLTDYFFSGTGSTSTVNFVNNNGYTRPYRIVVVHI